jgi:hypothetical protein
MFRATRATSIVTTLARGLIFYTRLFIWARVKCKFLFLHEAVRLDLGDFTTVHLVSQRQVQCAYHNSYIYPNQS